VPALVTLPALCIALFSTLAGSIADALGRRRIMIWAMVIYGLVGMLPLVIRDFWLILGSRVVVGMMEAVILCSSTTLIGDYFEGARRDHWLAMQSTTASGSSIIMFPLGGYVGQFGWQYPFAMYGFSLVLVVLLVAATWEPKESTRIKAAGFPWVSGLAITAAAAVFTWGVTRVAGWLTPLVIYGLCLLGMLAFGFVSARRGVPKDSAGASAADSLARLSWAGFPWMTFTGICFISAIASVMFYLLQILMANVLHETGVTNSFDTGIIIAAVSLGIPIGTLVFARISRTPISILLLLVFGTMAVGFWGMAAAPNLKWLMVASFVNQFGCGLALPTTLTWSMRQFTFAQRGRGIGIFQSFFNGGQFVGPTFVTWLAAQLTAGAIKPTYFYVSWVAGIMALGALIAIMLRIGVQPSGSPKTEVES
jgi:MFS family permease